MESRDGDFDLDIRYGRNLLESGYLHFVLQLGFENTEFFFFLLIGNENLV